ncbi:IclR family transcriptional regulator [Halococcus salsus]|uniref:IclR family transcriptional regulator n=1 Tax=Halococcus salsus TaxID=2162894 RepID=UPI00135A0A69|nr:IclR family transcriptional regulator [Halococcus salsus]
MGEDTRTLQTVERTIDIISYLEEMNGARVTEIAERYSVAASSVHAHLTTLRNNGYVVKQGDEYQLSLQFLKVGKYTQQRTEARRLADKYTRKLCDETGYRAIFLVEEHGLGVFLYMYPGEHNAWTHNSPGQQSPLHTLAAGKAILAHYPESRVREILEEKGMHRKTTNTITDIEVFLNDLERVRERGYAVNDNENVDGIRAIAVSAQGPANELIGSFGISGPTGSMTEESFHDDLPRKLREITDEFELELTL